MGDQLSSDTTRPDEDEDTLPLTHEYRTLVLCFDGTGNQIDKNHTNVSQFFSMLKKEDRSKQMVFYQTGIGTYTTKDVIGPISSRVVKTLDSMFAGSINDHVKDGYEFLMQNYKAEDRICVFGFSRGAYTARVLVGMIQKVGLLPPSNIRHIGFAYKAFLQSDNAGWKQAQLFKKCFSISVDVEFVGIWDSVGSLGLNRTNLPFTTSSTTIKTFRHALSLDERRARFQTNVWTSSAGDSEESTSTSKPKPTNQDKKELALQDRYTEKPRSKTDVQEVWFAGCHSDVGGGSVPTGSRHSLARISLRWMVRECFKANTGILFSVKFLRELGMDPAKLYPFVVPRPGPLPVGNHKIRCIPKKCEELEYRISEPRKTEEEEELYDALSPIHDQLELAPGWWLLEVLPAKRRYMNKHDQWVQHTTLNLGKSRFIAKQHKKGVLLHRSVNMRMQAEYERQDEKSAKYKPGPKLKVEPIWVD